MYMPKFTKILVSYLGKIKDIGFATLEKDTCVKSLCNFSYVELTEHACLKT